MVELADAALSCAAVVELAGSAVVEVAEEAVVDGAVA